jgi:VCBS repeat protein
MSRRTTRRTAAAFAAAGLLAAPARAECPYILGQATIWATGAGPLAAIGDLDADGKVDLVALTYDPPAGAVLLAQGDGGFVKTADLVVGAEPASALVADLDADQKLDIVVVNQSCAPSTVCGPGSISVLLGRGDGTFADPVTYATGASPLRAVAAHLDGDAVLDLAVADEVSIIDTGAAGLVSVLIGQGDGTFAAAVDYAAGDGVRGLVAGDFDGDGAVDLAMANDPSFGNSHISLLHGAGDGTFAAPADLATCQTPVQVAAADFDHDGRDDLGVACGSPITPGDFTSTLSVLVADSGGAFGSFSRTDHPVAFGAADVGVTDVDGDGESDLAVLAAPTAFAGVVSVLRGAGDGSFADAVDSTMGAAETMGFADLDGDGKADLAVGAAWGTATVVLGAGDGSFGIPADMTPAGLPLALAAGDLDGDGTADLAVATSACSSCPCAPGRLAGVLPGRGRRLDPSSGADTAALPLQLVLLDFTGDGALDAATTGDCNPKIRSNRGRGDGTFDDSIDAAGTVTGTLAAGDFDGDGRDDLAVADAGAGTVHILLSQGDGTFNQAGEVEAGPGAAAMTVADLDGDGDLDIAVADSGTPVSFSDSGLVSILLGDGAGAFAKRGDAPLNSLRPLFLAAGALDGTGGVDLAVLGQLGSDFGGVATLLGAGDGTFVLSDAPFQLTAKEPTILAAADFQADGRLDVVVGMSQSAAVRLLEGQGDGTFRPSNGYGPSGGGFALVAADLDGDGRPDLALANPFSGALSVFWSTCAPAPPPPDGGIDAGSDAGSDGGAAATGSGGCGCRVGGERPVGPALALLLALCAILAPRPVRGRKERGQRALERLGHGAQQFRLRDRHRAVRQGAAHARVEKPPPQRAAGLRQPLQRAIHGGEGALLGGAQRESACVGGHRRRPRGERLVGVGARHMRHRREQHGKIPEQRPDRVELRRVRAL